MTVEKRVMTVDVPEGTTAMVNVFIVQKDGGLVRDVKSSSNVTVLGAVEMLMDASKDVLQLMKAPEPTQQPAEAVSKPVRKMRPTAKAKKKAKVRRAK